MKLKTATQKSKQFIYLLELILIFFTFLYIILFSFLSIHRMYALNSHYYDLGIMNQTVYNTARGHFLEMSNAELQKNLSRLAIHFDPILAFIAPFYWIWPGPEVLLIVQTLILASGAWAIFLIAKTLLKNKPMSLFFSIFYLLFFQLERANLYDFHGVTLATGFLLWMIYFSLKKNWLATFIFIFLSLLTKEHVGLVVFLYGVYLFFVQKDKKQGFLISFIGGLFFIAVTFLVIPFFRGGNHFALTYYSNLKYISLLEIKDYLKRLLLPNLPYMIFSPVELLISLPEILINSISSSTNMRSFYFHYSSLVIPFIFFSTIKGAAKLEKSKIKYIVISLFVISNCYSIYHYSPLPLKFLKEPYYYSSINKQKINQIRLWQKKLIDENIKVATTPKLAPFFTNRRYFYNYDATYLRANISKDEIFSAITNYNDADYVIINKDEIGDPEKDSVASIFYKDLLLNSKFKIISDQDGIEVFQKI